ncbi:MAG: bifunctional adenosylcobinamide kinase/adenosylcobinamide-phosphate guanylyltransferase [Ruminiclostridium sp.]|nr:bifunctional adenosylcobinamide kinase/adenosylcobinamide-phosphate guanylyltransferase [Ruminiclostridium sp.]
MTTLITGGAKCGKSRLAEKLLDDFTGSKIYIATMMPYGEEALAAIARHRKIRAGKHFMTIDRYTDLDKTEFSENCGILLECMANLCANEMFRGEDICDPTENILRGIIHLQKHAEKLVIVTNNVGSDGIEYSGGTAGYIEVMGRLNARTAELCDNVIECVYGVPVVLKGKLCF